MSADQSYTSRFNGLLTEFYKLSTELQMLVCIVLWIYIAILIRLMYLGDGLPSDHEVMIAFLILLVGLLVGPVVGAVTALICIVLISPAGLFPATDPPDNGLWIRAASFLLMALTGGLLHRLIRWLNTELYAAQHQNAGTDLPNLKATVKYLEKVIASGKLSNKDLDVLNVRLSNLDSIRESAGQDTVNQLLRRLADQLQQKLGEGAYVSQLSGDELLGIHAGEGRDIADVQKIVGDLLAKPITLDGENYQLTASTGMYRDSRQAAGLSPQQLLDKAVKMAIAAQNSNTAFKVAAQSDSIPQMGESYSSLQIHSAMEADEIVLFFEPRLNTRTGYFSALQAVVRWNHPRRGELEIDDFKTMLENEAAVQGFSAWMLKLAFAAADEWASHGYKFRLALNITVNDVLSAPVLAYALAESGKRDFKPGWLALEVSEKALLRADAKALQYLKQLQVMHTSVVVSQFGEGGCTVQDIFNLPVDAVKFSAELVEGSLVNSDQRRQLASMIKLVHSRGLVTIADGVKTSNALRMLRTLTCEELQGSLLSKPLPSGSIPWARVRIQG